MDKINYFTSEAVAKGHPDKLCDQISDTLLDYFLKLEKDARVAIECLAATNNLVVAGEVSVNTPIDYLKLTELIKTKISQIGYQDKGFNPKDLNIQFLLDKQSPDIAMGVDKGGAGDQGIMFGGACKETKEYLPLAITLASDMMNNYNNFVSAQDLDNILLKPDAKCQITLEYKNNKPYNISTIVLSCQHIESLSLDKIKEIILKEVINKSLTKYSYATVKQDYQLFINPTGKFAVGGPVGDIGLTGRKIICDTYGGYFHHGGGAFSGKDPSKVDRSASYMARYLSKNIVAANLAEVCEIQLAYIIGIEKPCAIYLNCFNTEKLPIDELIKLIEKTVDLTPNGIIKHLGLKDIDYYGEIAANNHFMIRNNLEMPWEKLDLVKDLTKTTV